MRRSPLPHTAAALLAAAVAVAACRTAGGAAPGASAGPTAGTPADRPWTPAGAATAATASPTPAAADVAFMRQMIGHHAQALTMTALVPERTARAELRTLAQRIEATQRDEIALMRRWLERRGVAAVAEHAAHADHPMPGMLSAAELQRLAAARGAEFERLFLESMIRHHDGALAMVAEYFKTPGAGQEPEAFRLASDVDADQRAEIRRMRALLP